MKKAFLLSSLCFFISCSVFIAGYADYSSAKKYFKKGQYDLAAYHLSKSLTLKPNNKKAINLFELSYDIAVSGHKQNIRKLLSINNNSKWPRLVEEYNSLIKLGGYVNNLRPLLKNNINYDLELIVDDFSDKLLDANKRAAQYHYNLGLKFQDEADKENQKKAAINFRLSQNYIPDYLDSKELYKRAKRNATYTLLIREFDGNRKYSSYIRDQIMMNQSNKSKEFLRIINRDELETILSELALVQSGITENDYLEISELSGADHILSATMISSFNPAETITDTDIKQKKEVVIKKEAYVDSTGETKYKEIKGMVRARVDHYKKQSGAKIRLSYKIININDSKILYNGEVNGKNDFFHEWATYEGDKRALNYKYKNLVKRKDKFAPSENDLLMSIAKDVSKKFANKIAKHYEN